MNVIHSLLVHGHKVLFTENEAGELDFHLEEPILDEEFHSIVCYMIDEGIFEDLYGKEAVDAVIEEARREFEEDEDL